MNYDFRNLSYFMDIGIFLAGMDLVHGRGHDNAFYPILSKHIMIAASKSLYHGSSTLG